MNIQWVSAARILVATSLGVGTTLALLLLMQGFIDDPEVQLNDPPPLIPVDYVRLPELGEPPSPPPPPEPPRIEPPPDSELEQVVDHSGGGYTEVVITDPGPLDDHALDIGRAMADGGPLALVKVTPQYPRRAVQRSIEGYVIVKFTVDARGRVVNPIVIEAEPRSVFDDAALDAVLRFKYKPKVVNGEAVPVHDVVHRIAFEMADA